jgi:hydrogenase-1 operon protein HyaF
LEYFVNRLADIAIRVEPPARTGGLGGGVAAVLSEIVGMLEELARGGSPATVDLRSLPMSPTDRSELKSALGEGEVRATLDADGLSTLRETRVSGVWWIEHRDRQGELIAELLEVTSVPQILKSACDEIASSARELRERISLTGAIPADERDHALRQ